MKSLRKLLLFSCGLRRVPAFIGKLKSLEVLYLSFNELLQIEASTLDFLIEGCPRLLHVSFRHVSVIRGRPTPESLAHLEAFKAKMRGTNPDAEVEF
jgi:hypothetical protein